MKLSDKLHKLQSKMQTWEGLVGGHDFTDMSHVHTSYLALAGEDFGTTADVGQPSFAEVIIKVDSEFLMGVASDCQSLSAWESKLGRQCARARCCAVHHLVHHICVGMHL
jgi:hypothetical protein